MGLKLIALALVTSAHAAAVQAQPVVQAVAERPRIVVGGFGEVKTPPDVATIGYMVRGEGTTSDEAVRAMTATATRIEAGLRAIDPTAEPRTSDVKVNAVKSSDCKEQPYGAPQLSSGSCAIVGYVARQLVTLRTAAAKDAGTMVGLVGRGGGLDARINSFGLRDPKAAQQQATAAALADAAAKATGIAAATRVRLGPILLVTSGARNEVQDIISPEPASARLQLPRRRLPWP
jgi:uncharacterized protein YggE